jgi:hypothetical protein
MFRDPQLDAFRQSMRHTTTPVSAFFLIDSLNAITRCFQELHRLLSPYGMPVLVDSSYFRCVRQIYEDGREVLNVDHDVELTWRVTKHLSLLRCHSVDKGRYEIELWLPGVVANEVSDQFSDGYKGFFCAFMPPSFYD